jgi:hypothetical protein
LATLADRVGVDLWNYRTADGRSIRKAVDFMLPYTKTPPEKWPYQQIVTLDRSELAPILHQAAVAYHDLEYERVLSQVPGVETHSFQLLHPLPDDLQKELSPEGPRRNSGLDHVPSATSL